MEARKRNGDEVGGIEVQKTDEKSNTIYSVLFRSLYLKACQKRMNNLSASHKTANPQAGLNPHD